MEKENPILDKSYTFAVQIVLFCHKLQEEKKEYVLTKQLLRSGTSIGSNVEEGTQAQSKKDFISKMCIALKEAHETRYWLKLLRDTKIADQKSADAFIQNVHELIRLLVAIIKTSKAT